MIELNKLNPMQQKAVFTNKNKVLVMSGAGAGKTRVLTNRIAYLISQGVSESEIVAFTFTNKAAREMKARLNLLLGKETSAFIGTFHSFCYQSIKELGNYTKLGFKKSPEIISEYDKGKLIKELLSKYNKDYSNQEFVSSISKIKNGVKPNLSTNDQYILNAVYQEYQARLKESSMMDFDDMVPLFLKLMDIDKEYFINVCSFKYVLVDECQDTNKIQYDLIQKVSELYHNIFMVGDEDQLIYSFRSSDIEILKDFETKADEIIILNENYRCNKEIIKLANKLISNNKTRLNKELVSNIEPKRKVVFKEFDSAYLEAVDVVNKIKMLHLDKEEYKDMAILYRNNVQMYTLEKVLTKEKIPYTVYGGKPFFEYADIRIIINMYRFIYNPYNLIAFEDVYNKPTPIIEWYQMKPVLEEYRKQKEDIPTFLIKQDNVVLKKLGEKYLKLIEAINTLEPERFFMLLLDTLHYSKYLKDSKTQKPECLRLMQLKDMITDLSKEEVKEFFNSLMIENKDMIKPQGVSLMTIHKSKGLEFNTVFIVGCNDGIIPSTSKVDLEEDRRVFYVAMTRARQNLFLYSSAYHYVNGKTMKYKPSQFIKEIGLYEDDDFFGNYGYNI